MPSSYSAEMFRPGSGARAVTGTFTVESQQLVFHRDIDQEPSDALVLPTQGLGCRLSGYDNRTFFFTHPSAEGAEVAVKDPLIASDELLNTLAVFQEARRVGRSTHRRFWGCVGLLALGAVLVLAGVGTLATLLLRWALTG